jgi:hypothetical protein
VINILYVAYSIDISLGGFFGFPGNLDELSPHTVSMTEGLLHKDIRKIFRHKNN